MRPKRPPNTQTIASLWSYGHNLSGLCGTCKPPGNIIVDMPTLIEPLGPDCLVTTAIREITCKDCGARVGVHVSSPEVKSSLEERFRWEVPPGHEEEAKRVGIHTNDADQFTKTQKIVA
jgi:hypothetical protein